MKVPLGTSLTWLLTCVCSSFYVLTVLTQEDTRKLKQLVIFYDEWVDLSPSGRRHEDLHAKATFRTVASTFHLELEFLQVSFEELFLHQIWRSELAAGVISIGACAQNLAVLSLANRSNVPALVLDSEPCNKHLSVSLALPIHRVKIHRRYQCVLHVIYQWLTFAPQPPKPSPSYDSPLLPSNQQSPGRDNYHQEYLNCVGPDVLLEEDEIDPEAPPPEMKMELAKRFLSGRKLTIATIHRPPFVVLDVSDDDVIVAAKGFCLEMLTVLAEKFNFTYKLVLPYDGNWGARMPNGTFDGMVGMVQRQMVDFAIASFTITYQRNTVIDFTHPFYEDPTTILIPPPKEEDNFLAFLSPFSWQVWLLTLVSILVVGSMMWVLATVGDLPVLYPHNYRNVSYSLLRYVWDCAFSLTSQGNRMKQTEPVRVLNGIWWTFSVILIYTYTGTLIAFLTVPKLSSLIESLEELANQREVLWTYRAKTAHDSLFSSAPPPGTYYKIGQLLKERPELLVRTDKDGVDAVLKGNTAFIKEKSYLDFVMEEDYIATNECRLYQVKQLFFSAGFGWVMPQHSHFLPLFNAEILRMMQSGLFTTWKQKYWPKPNKCTAGTSPTGSGPKALHYGNFLGHFFIFGTGLGVAIIALVIERVYQRMVAAKVTMGRFGSQNNSLSQKMMKKQKKETSEWVVPWQY